MLLPLFFSLLMFSSIVFLRIFRKPAPVYLKAVKRCGYFVEK